MPRGKTKRETPRKGLQAVGVGRAPNTPNGRRGPSRGGGQNNRDLSYKASLRQNSARRNRARPEPDVLVPASRGQRSARGGRLSRPRARITSAPYVIAPNQDDDQDESADRQASISTTTTDSSFSPSSHSSLDPSSTPPSQNSTQPSSPSISSAPPSPFACCCCPHASAAHPPHHRTVCESCSIITSASGRLYRRLVAGLSRERALLDRWADEVGVGDGSTIEEMEWRPEATTYVVMAERRLSEAYRLFIAAGAGAGAGTEAVVGGGIGAGERQGVVPSSFFASGQQEQGAAVPGGAGGAGGQIGQGYGLPASAPAQALPPGAGGVGMAALLRGPGDTSVLGPYSSAAAAVIAGNAGVLAPCDGNAGSISGPGISGTPFNSSQSNQELRNSLPFVGTEDTLRYRSRND